MEAVQGGTGVFHVYRAQWRFHPELRRALPQRRADQYGVRGIDGELRREQTDGEEAANAVEQAGGPLAAADPHPGVERRMGGDVPPVVSGIPCPHDAGGGLRMPSSYRLRCLALCGPAVSAAIRQYDPP